MQGRAGAPLPEQPGQEPQLVEEHDDDGHGSDVFHEEYVGREEAEAQASLIGQFGLQHPAVYAHAYEDAGQQAAQREHDLGREIVQGFKERQAADGEVLERAERERTERAEQEHADGDQPGGFAAAQVEFLQDVGRGHFVQRYGGREGGHGEQDVEYQRPEETEGQLLENVRQRDEDQFGSGRGGNVEAEHGGENHHARQDGHEGIDDGHLASGHGQVGVFREIGTVGDETAHAEAQRVEGLAQRADNDGGRQLAPFGLEKVAQPLARPGERQGTDAHHDENQEQQGHHDFRGALNAFVHPGNYDKVGEPYENGGPQDGPEGVGGKVLEAGRIVGGVGPVQTSAKRLPHVLERPARHHGIVTENEESGQNAVIPYPAPGRMGRQLLERSDRVAPGMAAEKELRNHDRQAQEDGEENVEQEESRPAVVSQHIGKAPDAPQPDRTPHGGENGS